MSSVYAVAIAATCYTTLHNHATHSGRLSPNSFWETLDNFLMPGDGALVGQGQ